jgi:tellurite resistance protein TehA-like permease
MFDRFTRQHHTPNTLNASWLLPIVASVVIAATGAVVSNALLPFYPHLARSTIIISYIIWGTGVPMAMFIIALYIYRLAMGGTPKSAALPSLFLPLGPCGQASYGILMMGVVIRTLAYDHGIGLGISPKQGGTGSESMLRIADAVYAGGIVTSLILWGLGFVW